MLHQARRQGRPSPLSNAATPGCCTAVDLELVLAVDVSGSIDAEEAALQRRGYLDALTSRKVIRAIEVGPLGRIALAYVEWGDREHQRVVVGWRLISGRASALAVADEIAGAGRQVWLNTSISGAIDFSVRLFDRSGFESPRRIIDISGDGYSNDGREAPAARDDAIAAGVTINGLPILDDLIVPGGLDRYYAEEVIGGPGAFQVVANDFADFGRAIQTKLALEVAGLTPQLASRLP
ncbi:MAG TPA: DUF1194 domain-containing protein [Inquilinus sp.]